MPFTEASLARVVDIILAVDPVRQDSFVGAQMLVDDVDEIAGAVGAGNLAIAEHVADGDGDQVLAFVADEFAFGQETAEGNHLKKNQLERIRFGSGSGGRWKTRSGI
jgi:hypothetical protein